MIDTNLGDYIHSLMHQNNECMKPMTYMLSIIVEEVLPRPDSGLLKRMLRMSEIPVGMVEGSGEPILYLRTGSECHISISLIELNNNSSQSMHLTGPHRYPSCFHTLFLISFVVLVLHSNQSMGRKSSSM